MDVIKAVQGYVERMVKAASGMKVLLMDKETAGIISVTTPQSYLLENEVYLVDYLEEDNRERLGCLNCLCFVRPTSHSIELLVKELKTPKYSQYYLFFSNTLKNSFVERLAEADEHELVVDIQELFADFYAFNSFHFTFNLDEVVGEQINAWNAKSLVRTTEGLISLLLALRKRPIIRYDRASLMASRIAHEVQDWIGKDGAIFDFRQADTLPVLIILDRRNDLVTPLLLQWTYEAILHDLFGIRNGRVNVSKNYLEEGDKLASAGMNNDKQFVLSEDQDPFYRDNLFINYGDLSSNVKSLVDQYKRRNEEHANLDSITDMKRFVEEYPEYRKLAGNVSKHMAIVTELYRLVDSRHLLRISELEQNIVHGDNPATYLTAIDVLLGDQNVDRTCKFKLILLYVAKHVNSSGFNFFQFIDLLGKHGITAEELSLIDFFVKFVISNGSGRATKREEAAIGKTKATITSPITSPQILPEVNTVYQQHLPPVLDVVDQLARGKLPISAYPIVASRFGRSNPDNKDEWLAGEKSQDIIVFFVNGSTCEESYYLNRYCMANPAIRVLLGGTSVHNSHSLINEIKRIKKHLGQ